MGRKKKPQYTRKVYTVASRYTSRGMGRLEKCAAFQKTTVAEFVEKASLIYADRVEAIIEMLADDSPDDAAPVPSAPSTQCTASSDAIASSRSP